MRMHVLIMLIKCYSACYSRFHSVFVLHSDTLFYNSCLRVFFNTDCGQPKISADINWATPNDTSEGSSLMFACSEGFGLSSNQTLTCAGNGSWVGNIPICLPGRYSQGCKIKHLKVKKNYTLRVNSALKTNMVIVFCWIRKRKTKKDKKTQHSNNTTSVDTT